MLSKRLKAICSLVEEQNVIDIGCDHALLDIYLTINGKNCVAIDNKESVLKYARENIEKYNLTGKIKVILSNGLNDCQINKNETVVISGMGTNTIIEILKNPKFMYINTLIIQSNNELEKLRKYLVQIGYYIENELVVFEKKYYVIMKLKRGNKKYKKMEYKYGPYAIKNENYKQYQLQKLNELYKKIPNKNIIKKINIKMLLKKISKIKSTESSQN